MIAPIRYRQLLAVWLTVLPMLAQAAPPTIGFLADTAAGAATIIAAAISAKGLLDNIGNSPRLQARRGLLEERNANGSRKDAVKLCSAIRMQSPRRSAYRSAIRPSAQS